MIKLIAIAITLLYFSVGIYFLLIWKSKHTDAAIRMKKQKRTKIASVVFLMIVSFVAYFMFFFRAGPIELTKEELMVIVEERIEPEDGQWHYIGTREGYDYFHYRDRKYYAMGYLVIEGEIEIEKRFEGIVDEDQWILMPWGPNDEN